MVEEGVEWIGGLACPPVVLLLVLLHRKLLLLAQLVIATVDKHQVLDVLEVEIP